jgi:hypothetical protein
MLKIEAELVHASFLLGLLINTEDEGIMLLQTTG